MKHLLLAAMIVASVGVGAGSHAPAIVGRVVEHTVARGESWISIAARFGVDAAALAAEQGATPRRPLAVGTVIQIDARHIAPAGLDAGIVINLPQRMLFLKAGGEVLAGYPVGLGRPDWPTFIGAFTVVDAEVDPAWDVPPSIQEEQRRAGKKVLTRVPPGPNNPLGKFFLRLSEPNYGIHGTNAPTSIYRFETHGCIRLHPDDIAALFPRVPIGTTGEILYEPILLTVDASAGIWLEAHRDIYRRDARDPKDVVRERAGGLGVADRINWTAAQAVLSARDGRPRKINTQ